MVPSTQPEVPVEKPDPEAAKRPSRGGEERPGFSLGGANEKGDGELPEGGPVDDPALGAGRGTGGSTLMSGQGVKG